MTKKNRKNNRSEKWETNYANQEIKIKEKNYKCKMPSKIEIKKMKNEDEKLQIIN